MMMLASAGYDSIIILWWLQTSDGDLTLIKHKELTGHTANIMAVTFHPRGNILASAGGDKTIRLWSLVSNRHILLTSCI